MLARVRRGLTTVTFHRSGLRRFRDHAEAVAFLRDLAGDPSAVAAMRRALMGVHPVASISTLSTADVVSALARHVLDGSLLLEVSTGALTGPVADALGNLGDAVPAVPALPTRPAPPRAPAPPAAPPRPTAAAAPGSATAAAVKAATEPVETVQIEAVDVRVEIEQAMALMDMAQMRFDLGTASLQEIPGSLDRVTTSMHEVTNKTLGTLDAL